MDRLLRRLGLLPLGGAAIALIVALTLWRQNMNRLGYEHALPTIAALLAIAAAVTVALRLMLGNWARAGIASALVAAFAFYSVPVAATLAPRFAGIVIGALLVLAVIAARKIPAGDPAVTVNGKLNLLLVAALLYLAPSAAARQVQLERARPSVAAQFTPFEGKAAAASPDVWHILFDRYASRETLALSYDFDNRPLVVELQKRGFTVAEGDYSNYQRTAHSLAATLNGASLDRLAAAATGPKSDWLPIYRAISGNQASAFFERNGYRTVFAGTWWSPTRRIEVGELINYRALPELGRLMLDQSAVGAALRLTGLPYGDGRTEQCVRENDKFARLGDLADQPGRKYVFAHFLVPHPPFVLNADGSCRSLERAKSSSRRDNYVAQIQYSNAGMLRLVDRILASGRRSVIVIHSDEGPWPSPFVGNEHELGRDPVSVDWARLDGARLREKMGILMAVRGPDGPPATMPRSPVQIYPAVLKDSFGSRRPLPAATHQVFEGDLQLYRFRDVGQQLAAR